jgi:hypothetical protein
MRMRRFTKRKGGKLVAEEAGSREQGGGRRKRKRKRKSRKRREIINLITLSVKSYANIFED